MQFFAVIILTCFITSSSTSQESMQAMTEVIASAKINVTDNLNISNTDNKNSNVSLVRITQPSSNIETFARLNEETALVKNKSKSDFIPSPQLETYIEYNKYPVMPAFPEAKHMFPPLTYRPPVVTKGESSKGETPIKVDALVTTTSTDAPIIMAQDKQLFPTNFEKPIRNDHFFPAYKYYERFNYGNPSAPNSLSPSPWYNKVFYPVKPSVPVAEHPYPFVTDLTKVTPTITLPKSISDHSKMTPWKRAAKIFAAILPIGLLISALTPNILTISPANNTDQQCRRLVGRAENIGLDQQLIEKWSKPGCEARLLCETAVKEDAIDVESVKKLFWSFVSQNAEDVETAAEIEAVSNAIKENTCNKILCRKASKKHKTEEDN